MRGERGGSSGRGGRGGARPALRCVAWDAASGRGGSPAPGAGVLPVPLPGLCGGGRRRPWAGPRADGAARPLNGSGSGASTAPGPLLLAGLRDQPRGRRRSPWPCSAPRAVPAGTSRNSPTGAAVPVPVPDCSAAGAGPAGCLALPGSAPLANPCRSALAGRSILRCAESSSSSLGESGGGLGGLRPPRCSGNCRRWGKENKQAASVWSSKGAGLFLFTCSAPLFLFCL